MKNRKHWSLLGSTALVAASLLSGCSHGGKNQPVEPVAAVPQGTAASTVEDKPGGINAEFFTLTATVKAIDKKNRVVTLKFPDGKQKNIKCGPEVRNFPQIRIGDNVTAKFLESVELVVGAPGVKPSAEHESKTARAPLGTKPGFASIDAIEVSATVQSIDYQTRNVTLLGPEGKIFKVKAGAEVKRLNEVKQGDTVIARLTKAFSINVSKPGKN